jgi:hypothetical protein
MYCLVLLFAISAFVLASPAVGAAVEHNLSLLQNTPISWYTYLYIVICVSADVSIE